MSTRKRDAKAVRIVDGWQGYVPVLPARGPGRQEFRLVYEDGRLMESAELPASPPNAGLTLEAAARDKAHNSVPVTFTPAPTAVAPPPAPQDGRLTMSQAAVKCRCSLTWFSRNWKAWGLRPSRLGRFLFDVVEIDTLLTEKRITYRGRPRKVRGPRA